MNDIGNNVSLAETGLCKDKKTHRPYVSYGNISFPLLGILEHSKKKKNECYASTFDWLILYVIQSKLRASLRRVETPPHCGRAGL